MMILCFIFHMHAAVIYIVTTEPNGWDWGVAYDIHIWSFVWR